jgi:hypothetical protein
MHFSRSGISGDIVVIGAMYLALPLSRSPAPLPHSTHLMAEWSDEENEEPSDIDEEENEAELKVCILMHALPHVPATTSLGHFFED